MKLDDWQTSEPILLAFEEAWREGTSPSIDEFMLRDSRKESADLLAELVMIDFEHQWKLDATTNLDDYLRSYPELQQPPFRDELLEHEFQLRDKAGKFPDQAEIESRFSADSTVVDLWKRLRGAPRIDKPLESFVTAGTQVGTYRIEECVGRGAFATVYSAIDTRLQRRVALKFLTQMSDLQPAMRMRMLREAQAVASLQHPNVVTVYETGSFQSHAYIASQFVDGTTLATRLREDPPTIREAVELTRRLASALQECHRFGIVHRDIKPANIMIENGVPMLLDFGLALVADASHQLTHEGDMLGTPAFMSPEQADGRAWCADARSDIYSLGAVLFRSVCGRLPFEGTTAEIIGKVLQLDPTNPRALNPEVSSDLQTIILKCLQKDPTQRYETAADLEADLRRYLDGNPIKARPVSRTTRALMWARRRPALASLTAGVVALSLFLLGIGTQLQRVSGERNRARTAERETQALLAESAASAGQLAMQRGQVKSAIQHFQQSLDRGHPDQVGILLKLVEANVADRNLEAAAELWQQANSLAGTKGANATLKMWHAELALEGVPGFEDEVQLLKEAMSEEISEADRYYASGVLAESSPAAIAALQQATLLDPFHHRARRLLVFTLLSLARLEEVQQEIEIARQLFPEDDDFRLLECLRLATTNQLTDAEALLAECDLDTAAKKEWSSFCGETRRVTNDVILDSGIGQLDMLRLAATLVRFNDSFLPLLKERGWRIPVQVGERFTELIGTFPELLTSDDQRRAEAIDELVAIHPEASLLVMLGSLRLADVDIGSTDRDNQILLVESAREAFRKALEHPGFLKKDDQLAWKAIFTTSLLLSHSLNHELEQNTHSLIQAATHIETNTITKPSHARTFSIVTLNSQEYDEASRWSDRWLELVNPDDKSSMDAHWHQAVLRRKKKDWIGVKLSCDQMLRLDPEHEQAKAFRDSAIQDIKAAAEESIDGAMSTPQPLDEIDGTEASGRKP